MTDEKTIATTSEILGATPKKKINPAWKQHYLHLIELRQALQARQNRLAAEAKAPLPTFSEHMGEAGTDQYEQDFGLSMLSSDQSALNEIEMALDRIRNGTYGICELTGEPIEPERLEAIPWARFSLSAQHSLECQGNGGRTQFAPRRTLAQSTPVEDSEESNDTEEASA